MAKPIRRGRNSYRDRLLDLGVGMLGGVLAGAGVSFLITSRQTKRVEPQKKGETKGRSNEPARKPREMPSRNRRTTGSNRRSRSPGTKLAASNIQPTDVEIKEEPGTNDSLGG